MHTLADLTPDPANARKHTPRNVGTIVDSLHAVGAGRSIVIDEAGMILAGNATVEAAAQAGIERVQIVDSDGETLIAVRRTGLTPEQKTRLALADNRAAELATWDTDVLAQLQADAPDVLAGLWRADELANLLQTDPVDPAALWAGMPEFEQPDVQSWKQLIVHFANEADYNAFCQTVGQDLTLKTKSMWYPPRAQQTNTAVVEDES